MCSFYAAKSGFRGDAIWDGACFLIPSGAVCGDGAHFLGDVVECGWLEGCVPCVLKTSSFQNPSLYCLSHLLHS